MQNLASKIMLKMQLYLILVYLIGKNFAQINGEFWWLNDKVKSLKSEPIDITAPKIEELSEFDNDESDKVVFDHSDNKLNQLIDTFRNSDEDKPFNNHNNSNIEELMTWPEDETQDLILKPNTFKNKTEYSTIINVGLPEINMTKANNVAKNYSNGVRDEITFHFSSDSINILNEQFSNNTTKLSEKVFIPENETRNEKVIFRDNEAGLDKTESICTFIKIQDCNKRNGLVYKNSKSSMFESTQSIVCCIMPLQPVKKTKTQSTGASTKIIMPRRHSRSTNIQDVSYSALHQRMALINKRLIIQNKTYSSTIPPRVLHKIVTNEDEYDDPYANIRMPDFRHKTKQPGYMKPQNTYYGGGEDYVVDEYSDELPKPGLVGLYSDNENPFNSWSFLNEKPDPPYDHVEESPAVGYSTPDPRIDKRVSQTGTRQKQRKTTKQTTAYTKDNSNRTASATILYESSPDFQVLQGFKLLNLMRNKNKVGDRKSTVETESVLIGDLTDLVSSEYYDDVSEDEEQVYKGCGKAGSKLQIDDEFSEGESTRETEFGSHPWLALVVRRRRQQRTLCYATLVHPRAAVTAANCVYGTNPGELSLHIGLWDLNEESRQGQKRLVSVHLHPEYMPGDFAHDLAILFWHRPLTLDINVQPACFADPHTGDSCAFVGWGGHGQAIRGRSLWKRAAILSPRECRSQLDNMEGALPNEAFCASTETQRCVSGIGSPLICSSNGKHSAVGVAIWRDGCDSSTPSLLLPAKDWTRRALTGLGIV